MQESVLKQVTNAIKEVFERHRANYKTMQVSIVDMLTKDLANYN